MGAWIEIWEKLKKALEENGRTPRWVRGLKYTMMNAITCDYLSHPTMGAWIEITPIIILISCYMVAPHDGCVD